MRASTLALILLATALGWQSRAQLAISGMSIDGQGRAIEGSGSPTADRPPIRVPPGAKELQFAVGTGNFRPSKPYRLRCKMEGYDQDWIDLYSTMRVVIRVLDSNNRIISANEAKVDHTSPGWKGSVQNSDFTPAKLETIAPERAARVQIWCVSGGPEYTQGVFAFRNIRLRMGTPGTPDYREVTFSTDSGADLDQPLGSLSDWRRDGSRPQMAQVIRVDKPSPHHVLAVSDFDYETFAAWLTPLEKCPQVKPGEPVVAEWEEVHCVGQGGPSVLTYTRLPPGNYWLRVNAVDMENMPMTTEASLNFVVLTPIWYRLWFWLAVGGAGSIAAFLASRRITRRRMQREVDRLERQHLLERERTRIARDIHDDLGTSLTQISLLSESARKHAEGSPEVMAELDRICTSARESVQAMDEIVWAADPENDSLDELATYVSGFAQDLLNTVNVRCRLEMPIRLPEWNLSAEVRHNVFLAFKEALNNALKHGNPTEVRISLSVEQDSFVLSVEDNGKGFQPARAPTGNGLHNMRSRLEKSGGKFILDSTPGKGTCVRLVVPVTVKI